MYISSISNTYAYQSLTKIYAQLSSGSRVNSAADDAAGLAVSQKLSSQSTEYSVANNNIADSQNQLNSAEGALSSIGDSLQRIKELALEASNGTYSTQEKTAIQNEINQLKEQITSTAQGAQFNGVKTLDGSSVSLNGISREFSFDASLKGLGIEAFDVTSDFDIGTIYQAINKISSARGEIGAGYNSMTHAMYSNDEANLNTMAARSRIEDADYSLLAMQLKQNQTLMQVNYYMQAHKQNTMRSYMGNFLNMMA